MVVTGVHVVDTDVATFVQTHCDKGWSDRVLMGAGNPLKTLDTLTFDCITFSKGCTIYFYSFSIDITMLACAIVTSQDVQCLIWQINANIIILLL